MDYVFSKKGMTMKKIFLFFCLLLCTNVVIAQKPVIKNIAFLGDSLSDNGKLFSLLLFQIPKSPPYFKGRFSNGPTWAEDIAKYYYDKYYLSYKIYAFGGATAIFHLPTAKFISSSTLDLQVCNFLFDNLLKNKSETLAVIWIGNNDYLYYQDENAESLTNNVVNKIIESTKTLLQNGVKHILLLNLPDSSLAPYGRNNGCPQKLHELIMMNNKKLAVGVEKLKGEFKDAKIVLVDIYSILLDFVTNMDKYNKKYKTHVTNLHDACWLGGYINDDYFDTRKLKSELQISLMQNAALLKENGNDVQGIDIGAIVKFIVRTPELAYVYSMGKAYEKGLLPCANPDSYLFWDSMHPTEIVHRIMALIVRDQIAKPIFDDNNNAN